MSNASNTDWPYFGPSRIPARDAATGRPGQLNGRVQTTWCQGRWRGRLPEFRLSNTSGVQNEMLRRFLRCRWQTCLFWATATQKPPQHVPTSCSLGNIDGERYQIKRLKGVFCTQPHSTPRGSFEEGSPACLAPQPVRPAPFGGSAGQALVGRCAAALLAARQGTHRADGRFRLAFRRRRAQNRAVIAPRLKQGARLSRGSTYRLPDGPLLMKPNPSQSPYWSPFSVCGKEVSLAHIEPFEFECPTPDGNLRRIRVLFSHHVFTRNYEDGDPHEGMCFEDRKRHFEPIPRRRFPPGDFRFQCSPRS